MAGMERIKVAKMKMALIPVAAKKRHGQHVYEGALQEDILPINGQ
jgi:hypothetical protein